MTKLQKLGYSSLALFAGAKSAFAIDAGLGNISGDIQGDSETADVTVQRYLANLMLFLGLVAVLYAIYGGFLILTAAGDDGKVKKGKTILFQAILGIIVIFLAYSIVNWLLTMIVGTGTTA